MNGVLFSSIDADAATVDRHWVNYFKKHALSGRTFETRARMRSGGQSEAIIPQDLAEHFAAMLREHNISFVR